MKREKVRKNVCAERFTKKQDIDCVPGNSEEFEGIPRECDEGKLEWIPKEKLTELNMWPGDRIFNKLIRENAPFFSLKLSYKGDDLVEAVLNGKALTAVEGE